MLKLDGTKDFESSLEENPGGFFTFLKSKNSLINLVSYTFCFSYKTLSVISS